MEIVVGTIVLLVLLFGLIRAIEKKNLVKFIDAKNVIFQKTCDPLDEGIIILSSENKILYANKSIKTLLGLSDYDMFKVLPEILRIEVKGRWLKPDELISEYINKSQGKMLLFPKSRLHISGREEISANFYIEIPEAISGLKSMRIQDLTGKEEEQLQSFQHKLTKLSNQTQAMIDLNTFYSKTHLDNKKLALILVEIDNFSRLRAIIGHEQANNILIKFAKYLKQFSAQTKINVYHTFYNNFLLIIPKAESKEEVVGLAKKIQNDLVSFYKLDKLKLHLTASVGISLYTGSGTTLNLFDNAYKALAEAEKRGHGHIHVYQSEAFHGDYDELNLYNSIHEAIERDQFEVYYQPIFDVKESEIVGAEALIRWKHPEYGFISPEIFVPIMEKTGFVIELGQYVLNKVLKQLKRWELFKFKQISVSINLSLLEIEKEGFVDHVKAQLKKHQVDPELLKYEITEGLAMSSEELVNKQLWDLKKLGVVIALDDFGTGYTSFSYLKKFPASLVKIDKSMVENILNQKEDQRIVKAMIELGHTLGMKVVVEGIENQKMLELLASYNCDYMQGYYFSKPLPVFEFQELLRKS